MAVKITRGQAMAGVVALATILNVVVHFSHPAYRYYRQFCRAQEERFGALESRVRSDFVPAILAAVSNRTDSAAVVGGGALASRSGALEGGGTGFALYGADVRKDVRLRYFSVGGVPYVQVNGGAWITVGGDLFGEPVLRITPTALFTASAVYLFGDDGSIRPSVRKEVKNDVGKSV